MTEYVLNAHLQQGCMCKRTFIPACRIQVPVRVRFRFMARVIVLGLGLGLAWKNNLVQ